MDERPASAQSAQKGFIGSIDQGTTSSRFLLFDSTGKPVASHQVEFKQLYPQSGSVETCIEEATKQFLAAGYDVSEIKAIGVTNQRETTLVWDSNTGDPLNNAIVWPDTRTQALVRDLKAKKGALDLQSVCGLPLSTYPSSVKLLWLLHNNSKVKKAYEDSRLSFGTVDAWLLLNLTGRFVTDVTNASRTMFLNIHDLKYDDILLDFFKLDRSQLKLAEVVSSSHPDAFGCIQDGCLKGIPVTGCLGDQSAALVGQSAFSPGMAKNTYGTGCFLLYNVGNSPVISKHGLLATVAYDLGKPVYALEGSIAVAGSAVKFLVNNLGFFKESHEISDLALTVKDNGGVVFVTAFSGLFAPYWIDDAKGTIFGITHHTERGHIARATLEATCFQTKAILDAMEKDSGHKLLELAVDGGMSNSDLCMQTQADIIGIPVDRPAMREATALGAAVAAGFAIGFWNETDVKAMNREGRKVFSPQVSQEESEKMFKRWERAVEMGRGWIE
ncbi:MAG: Glycerol kinase [Vezdaea acicularis]|nr:MAG: Glycerol kinase [Vezdaea acicularis]